MNPIPETTRYLYSPRAMERDGCPLNLTPYIRETVMPVGEQERRGVIHKYTTMQLSHLSRAGVEKNSLYLRDIHHDLEANFLSLEQPGRGASNILLSHVSFDCLITKADGSQVRKYISFDLRIPGQIPIKTLFFPPI